MNLARGAKVTLGVVIGLQLLIAVAVPSYAFRPGPVFALTDVFGGLGLGVIALLAAWLPLIDAPRKVRLLAGLGLAVAVLFATLAGEVLARGRVEFFTIAMLVILYGLLVGLVWLVRLAGWRFTAPPAPPRPAPDPPPPEWKQPPPVANYVAIAFLIASAGGALLLSRFIDDSAGVLQLGYMLPELFEFSITFLLACLPGYLFLVGVLYRGRRRFAWLLLMAGGVLLMLAFGGLSFFMVPYGADVLSPVLTVAGSCGAVALLAGLLAVGGWRLAREGPNLYAPQSAEEASPGDAATPLGGFAAYVEAFRRHLPLWIVAACHCAFAGFMGLGAELLFDGESRITAFLFGMLAGQVVLGAIWITLYRAPFRSRVLAAALAGMVSSMLFFLGVMVHERGKPPLIGGLMYALGLACLLAFLSVPCLVWRAAARRLLVGPGEAHRSQRNINQFSLASLMLWTAGLAVLLGVMGRMFDLSPRANDFVGGELFYILAQLPVALLGLGFFALVLLPEQLLAGVILHPGRRQAWLVTWLILEPAMAGVFAFFIALMGAPPDEIAEILSYYVPFKLGVAGAVVGTLAILEACGYRSQPIDRPASTSPFATSRNAAMPPAVETPLETQAEAVPAEDAAQVASPEQGAPEAGIESAEKSDPA